MILGSFMFKSKARKMLKGDWQTAMVVTFFSGLFLTLVRLMPNTAFRDVTQLIEGIIYSGAAADGVLDMAEQLELTLKMRQVRAALAAIPVETWAIEGFAVLFTLIISPMFALSRHRYFIHRFDGEMPSYRDGFFERLDILLRSLWLYVLMYVKIALWSLLLVVPGIIAAMRYSMAPHYLSEHPELTARQAIQKSKETMKHLKLSYFLLQISFMFLSLVSTAVQLLFADMSMIAALVVGQFLAVGIATYMNAANAAFYCTFSRDDGMKHLMEEMRRDMRNAGVDDDVFDRMEENLPNEEDPPQDDGSENE